MIFPKKGFILNFHHLFLQDICEKKFMGKEVIFPFLEYLSSLIYIY